MQPQAAQEEACLVQLLPLVQEAQKTDAHCFYPLRMDTVAAVPGTTASTLAWELHFKNIQHFI